MMNKFDSSKGVFSMPPIPWKHGFDAGAAGQAVNPYSSLSRDAWAWSSGYIEGQAAAQKAREVMAQRQGVQYAKSTH